MFNNIKNERPWLSEASPLFLCVWRYLVVSCFAISSSILMVTGVPSEP